MKLVHPPAWSSLWGTDVCRDRSSFGDGGHGLLIHCIWGPRRVQGPVSSPLCPFRCLRRFFVSAFAFRSMYHGTSMNLLRLFLSSIVKTVGRENLSLIDLIYVLKDSPRLLGGGVGQDASSRLAGAGGDLGQSVWLLHNYPAWWARPTPGAGNGAPERGREAFLSPSAAGKPQCSPPCKGHLSSTAQGIPNWEGGTETR